MHATMSRTLLAVLAALTLLAAACEADDGPDEPLVGDTPAVPDEDDPTPAPPGEPDGMAVAAPGLEADEDATVVELLAGHDEFSELVAAIEAAGLEAELSADGPFTVFAPPDEGFAIVPEPEREALDADPELLAQRILAHIVDGELTADELTDGETVTMLDGTERQVLVTDDGEVFVGSAFVLETDVRAVNGLVHVIDFVLPSTPAEPGEEPAEDDESA